MTNKDHGTEVDRGTLVNELRSNLGGRVFQSYGDFLDFVSVDTETFAIFGDGNGIKITVPRGIENKAANWQSYLRPFCDETISTSLEFGKSYCGISRIDCALFGFNKPLAHNIRPFIGIGGGNNGDRDRGPEQKPAHILVPLVVLWIFIAYL
jgi:hypothetical protein